MSARKNGLGDWGRERWKSITDPSTSTEDEVLSKTLFANTSGDTLSGSGDTIAGHQQSSDGQDGGHALTSTKWYFPDSSRVLAYQYDYDTKDIRVRFIKYATPWIYSKVPVSVWDGFHSTDSKGRYINSTLNHFPYRRATAQEEAQFFNGV